MTRAMATSVVPELKKYSWKIVVSSAQLEAFGEDVIERIHRAEAFSKGTPIPSATEKFEEHDEERDVTYWCWEWVGVEFLDDPVDTKPVG